MNEKNNGGPAFPGSSFQNDSDVNQTAPNGQVVAPGDWVEMPGMSLRDYFAAKAMQGTCARELASKTTTDVIASEAYKMADAMLRARDA